jgi:methionine sulfoxide reductase heme-binding subunit
VPISTTTNVFAAVIDRFPVIFERLERQMPHDLTFLLIARITGIVAYCLLGIALIVWLVSKTRRLRSRRPGPMMGIHQLLSLMALLAVAAHGTMLVLDKTVEESIPDLLVPYGTLSTSLGVAAFEVMLVLQLSFFLRKRMGIENWRRLQWLNYGIFAAATAHGFMMGIDSSRPWALALYGAGVGLVMVTTVWWAAMARKSWPAPTFASSAADADLAAVIDGTAILKPPPAETPPPVPPRAGLDPVAIGHAVERLLRQRGVGARAQVVVVAVDTESGEMIGTPSVVGAHSPVSDEEFVI